MTPIALSIAGSDPSAGAGIQADLRMFFAQGVFGTSVITALTAQNPSEVTAVQGMPAKFVQKQLETIHALPISAIKTGMLWSADIISVVSSSCAQHPQIPLVVDPVMISTSGAKLISNDAILCYQEELFPLCTLLTPNIDEAEVLLEEEILVHNIHDAAKELHSQFGCAILLKGGHLKGSPIDILFDGENLFSWEHTRIPNINTHGTGCMLSAAITAGLAKKQTLFDAVDHALMAVQTALYNPIRLTKEISLAGIEQSNEKQPLRNRTHEIKQQERT